MAKTKSVSFRDVINSDTPTLVDFHATWCGPCHAFAPVLDQLKKEAGDAVKILKIDVDKNPQITQKLGVRSMPTVVVFKSGKETWRASGVQSIATLKSQLGLN